MNIPLDMLYTIYVKIPFVKLVNSCMANSYLNDNICKNNEFWYMYNRVRKILDIPYNSRIDYRDYYIKRGLLKRIYRSKMINLRPVNGLPDIVKSILLLHIKYNGTMSNITDPHVTANDVIDIYRNSEIILETDMVYCDDLPHFYFGNVNQSPGVIKHPNISDTVVDVDDRMIDVYQLEYTEPIYLFVTYFAGVGIEQIILYSKDLVGARYFLTTNNRLIRFMRTKYPGMI